MHGVDRALWIVPGIEEINKGVAPLLYLFVHTIVLQMVGQRQRGVVRVLGLEEAVELRTVPFGKDEGIVSCGVAWIVGVQLRGAALGPPCVFDGNRFLQKVQMAFSAALMEGI